MYASLDVVVNVFDLSTVLEVRGTNLRNSRAMTHRSSHTLASRVKHVLIIINNVTSHINLIAMWPMVKFGRHVDAFQNDHSASLGISIVPYNELKHIESQTSLRRLGASNLTARRSNLSKPLETSGIQYMQRFQRTHKLVEHHQVLHLPCTEKRWAHQKLQSSWCD